MRVLKNLSGSGALVADGRDLGPASYRLTVVDDGRWISGSGSLDGDFAMLSDAFNGNDVRLRLGSGEVKVILTNLSDRVCLFKTTGEIPGIVA